MKNRITSAISLTIFSIALVVASLIPSASEEKSPAVKTGVAISASVKDSKDATAEAGLSKAAITVATVTVDEKGKVVSCKIDALDVEINFNEKGVITTDLTAEVLTKKEKGFEYGMTADWNTSNKIGKEWFEQVEVFEKYCIGKTAEQITGITVNAETGLPDDADLAAGCTMHPAQFQYLVAEAITNATKLGATEEDKLGLAISTKLSDSKDANATPAEGESGDGLVSVATTIAVTTVNKDGKVTSALIDTIQADVTFDVTGKITSDLNADILTKKEQGFDYGMAADWNTSNKIGKEWFEQIAVFEKYCTGKTSEQILGITVNAETGLADDADLAAGCTMHPAQFQYVVSEAIGNAK